MSFQKYKEQVTIIEVAEAIGYVRNIKKGNRKDKGQVFERSYILNGKTYTDKIVINNLMLATEQQKYFNEEDSKGFEDRGDVIDFVAKRIHLFNVSVDPSKPFVAVNQVLQKFSNQVYDISSWIESQGFNTNETHSFNINDWTEKEAKLYELHYFIKERGISEKTINAFLPYIKKVSFKNWKTGNYNPAFPYTILPENKTVGYELKNYNLKLAASGTNKIDGSWHTCFASAPGLVYDIFLFESGIDAMSYYDLYSSRVSFANSAFFSIGGSLSKSQLEHIINYYPTATIHTCFDNDFKGNLYDIQTACIKSNKTYSFFKEQKNIKCGIGDKEFVLTEGEFNLTTFISVSGLRPKVKSHRAKNAKDFNEMLLNLRKKQQSIIT